MTTEPQPLPFTIASRADQIFPVLTAAQIARLEPHGSRRTTERGALLSRPGIRTNAFYVVVAGRIEVFRRTDHGDEMIAGFGPGQFNGEVGILSAMPGLTGVRVAEAGAVIEVEREHLLGVIQTDGELSELLMRAFILRRVELIRQGVERRRRRRLAPLRRHAARARVPDAQRAPVPIARRRIATPVPGRCSIAFSVTASTRSRWCSAAASYVLRNPTNRGDRRLPRLNDDIDAAERARRRRRGRGSGRSRRRGLRRLRGPRRARARDACAPGGQAGSSSRIENYLGFPTGISGQALAGARATRRRRSSAPRWRSRRRGPRSTATARPYRRLAGRRAASSARARSSSRPAPSTGGSTMPTSTRFEGAGVYYGATLHRSAALRGRRGRGGRRRQLRRTGGGVPRGRRRARVHMLVRGRSLAASMSRYLIRRIEEHPTHRRCARAPKSEALEGADDSSGCSGGNGHRRARDARPSATCSDDRRRAEHRRGSTGCVVLDDQRLRQDRRGPDAGGSRGRALDAAPAAPPARDQPPRRVRVGDVGAQRQARRVGRGRGIRFHFIGSPGTRRVREPS